LVRGQGLGVHRSNEWWLSCYEAEYITDTGAKCQAVWLHRLLEMVGVKVSYPHIKMDNMTAITLSKNLVLHDRSKHINTHYHFIKECVDHGEVVLQLGGTQNRLADMFMKAPGRVSCQWLIGGLRVLALVAQAPPL
jgi:hypothetical protein